MNALSLELPHDINPKTVPQHVAIIMDGNGRWAKQQGKMRIAGHKEGVEAAEEEENVEMREINVSKGMAQEEQTDDKEEQKRP